ncbi:hypothetical protein BC834DRAFT_977075 [Gloeopeniophorella convolvens]|nr:hypothetical protein BC834DRAFT_977075 [Gloeopeniophorella convolvens]
MSLSDYPGLRFLDLEAIRDDREEEEEEDEEDDGFLNDDGDDLEEGLDEEGDDTLGANRLLSSDQSVQEAARDAEQHAQRFRSVASNARPRDPSADDSFPVDLRLSHINDPDVWCVKVKRGCERDVVFQLARRSIQATGSRSPAIASAFSRDSIPGYVFIESLGRSAVTHAISGLVLVLPTPPVLIDLDSRPPLLHSRALLREKIEVGQWVRCDLGRYHGDIGFVFDKNDEYDQNLVVALVPRLHPKADLRSHAREGEGAPRASKRKRASRPEPHGWDVDKALEEWGRHRVKLQENGCYLLDDVKYDDHVVFWPIPSTHVRACTSPPIDLTPFFGSATLRDEPTFVPWLLRSIHDTVKQGTRVLVTSGELQGLVGYADRVTDRKAQVVARGNSAGASLPEMRSILDVDSMVPYFIPGDPVKARWSTSRGVVIQADYETNKLVYVDMDYTVEMPTNTYAVEFDEPEWLGRKFPPGLWVEFDRVEEKTGRMGLVRARILSHEGTKLRLAPEDNHIKVVLDVSEVRVCAKQDKVINFYGATVVHLSGKDVMVTKGPMKGHRGSVKGCNEDGASVQLHSYYVVYGHREEWFPWKHLALVTEKWADRMHEPSPQPRTVTPPPPDIEDSGRATPPPPSLAVDNPPMTLFRDPQDHWIHTKEIQTLLAYKCLALSIPNTSGGKSTARKKSAKTVILAERLFLPNPGEVIVNVVEGRVPTQVSADPRHLVPWPPSVGSEVVIVLGEWVGWVGKVEERIQRETGTAWYRVRFDASFPGPDRSVMFIQDNVVPILDT